MVIFGVNIICTIPNNLIKKNKFVSNLLREVVLILEIIIIQMALKENIKLKRVIKIIPITHVTQFTKFPNN